MGVGDPPGLPFNGRPRTVFKGGAILVRVLTQTGVGGFALGLTQIRAAHGIDQIIGPFLEARDLGNWRSLEFRGGLKVERTRTRAKDAAPVGSRILPVLTASFGLLDGSPAGQDRGHGSFLIRRMLESCSAIRLCRAPRRD